ncbi:MAG: Mur ligase family protein, partial [Candidatus Daviesbacteria bacterium]|nr:Mur ligase family protein [Candidatus Daviesbacteria bacterium]
VGRKVSMISTINATIAGKSYDTGFHVTSPKETDIQRFIKEAVKAGDEFIVLEVTSHALDQFRTWGINFEVGVITNITHEHLDYHKTFESYLNAKAKLIQRSKVAVLPADDPNFAKLTEKALGKVISFGLKNKADLTPKKITLKLKILGDYNLLNALAAMVACEALGIEVKKSAKILEAFKGLSGRMEEIPNNLGIKIIVDFAHTPNALEQALKTLRKESRGKLISVFGAAAERDIGKRPIMGRISAQLADITILTDEDPRFDESLKIIDEIASGAVNFGAKLNDTLFKSPDRKQAIKLALSKARPGDTIGIFGKGHEKSMNYKGVEKPWSDQGAVLDSLKNG